MTEEGKAPESKNEADPKIDGVDDVEKVRANAKEMVSRYAAREEKARQELAEFKEAQAKAAKEAELAKLDEVERAKKINEDLQAQLESERNQRKQDLIKNRILLVAQREGALKPDHVHAVMDKSGIDFGEDGAVMGVEESVAKFKEENAFYFGSVRAAGGPPQGEMAGRDLPHSTADADPEARMTARLERRVKLGLAP